MNLLLPIIGLFVPFLLWPVELVVGYPYIVEELAKAILVTVLVTHLVRSNQRSTIVLLAISWSLSETVLYIFNLSQFSSPLWLGLRLLTTSLMHTLTFLIMLTLAQTNRWLLVGGLIMGILIHYYYNSLIAPYLITQLWYI